MYEASLPVMVGGISEIADRYDGYLVDLWGCVHNGIEPFPEAVDALADSVFAEFKEVNLLFNNAGVLVDGKSWERPLRDWRWLVDVNVMGVIHGLRSFVPRMLTQGGEGRIINTSSIGGLLGGGAFMAPYPS